MFWQLKAGESLLEAGLSPTVNSLKLDNNPETQSALLLLTFYLVRSLGVAIFFIIS